MKANEAPERIYCESDGIGNIVKVHNIKWPDDEAENIEYTRTDDFIEKACSWLSNMSLEDMEYKYDDFDTSEGWYKMIENFRKYMEESKVWR